MSNRYTEIKNIQDEYQKIAYYLDADQRIRVFCDAESVLDLQYFYLIQMNKTQEERAKLFVSVDGEAQKARVKAYLSLMDKLYPNTIYYGTQNSGYAPSNLKDNIALGKILPLMEINLCNYQFLAEKVADSFTEFIQDNRFCVNIKYKTNNAGKEKKTGIVDFTGLKGSFFEREIKKICLNYLFTKGNLHVDQWEKRKKIFQGEQFYKEVKGLSTFAFLLFCAYDKTYELDGMVTDDRTSALINACDIADGTLQLMENVVYHAGKNENDGKGLLSIRIHSNENENSYLNKRFKYYFNGYTKSISSQCNWDISEKQQKISFEDINWNSFSRIQELAEEIADRKNKRRAVDYYIEIQVCDNSGKSIIEEYKKTLGNKTDKLTQMKIGDLFAPSTKDIQEAIDAINQEGENAVHHYGLGLFDSLVSSIDGCFIARNKKVSGKMELYSSSGDGEEKDMIPGTQYSILLPLKKEEQEYSNLNSDIRYTISNTYTEAEDREEKVTENRTFLSQSDKEDAIHDGVKTLEKICSFDRKVIRFDAQHLGNIEIFIKALLLRLKQENLETEKNIAICNCDYSQFIEITRILAVFYNKGKCDLLENVQLYMCGKKREDDIFDEFWMGGCSLSELLVRVSKLTFAKSFSPRIVNILKAMLLKRTVIEKPGCQDKESKDYHYTPFDLIIKDKEQKTVFEYNVEKILNIELEEKRFGCKISNTHMRIGSKIHVDNFYEAQLLFHNNYFTNRFAYLLKQKLDEILQNREGEKIYFVGYENYSEMLLYELTQLYDEDMVEYCIYEVGMEEASEEGTSWFRRLNLEFLASEGIQIVYVVPVNSTLSTFNKLEAEFMQAIGPVKSDIINESVYFGIIQTRNVQKNIGNGTVEKQRNIEDDFWEEIKVDERKVITHFESTQKKKIVVDYLVLAQMVWQDPLLCRQCYPPNFLQEEPLIETDKSSIIPSQMIGLRENDKDVLQYEIASNYKRLAALKRYVREGHYERNKSHYQYYINSEEFFENNRDQIALWLEGIRKDINPFSDTLHYDIIVCPIHSSNAAFVELVNEKIFGSASLVIHFTVEKEFRDNFIAKYSDIVSVYNHLKKSGQRAAINFIFVDDEIIKGRTIERTKSLIKSLFPNEKSIVELNIFHSVITLVNRLSSSTITNYCNKDRYYSYVDVRISHLRTYDNACVLCNSYRNAEKLAKSSAMYDSELYWREKETDYELIPVKQGKAQNHKMLEEEKEYTSWLHLYCSHRITDEINRLQNREEVIDVFNTYIEIMSDKKTVKQLEVEYADYIKSCFYVACHPFISFRKVNREVIFKLVLIALEVILDNGYVKNLSQKCIEKNLKSLEEKSEGLTQTMLQDKRLKNILSKLRPGYDTLRFFMQQSVDLRSNYIIRKDNIFRILEYIKACAKGEKREKCLEEYRMLITDLVSSGTDEAKITFLEHLLLFGEEYSLKERDKSNSFIISQEYEEYYNFFGKLYIENTRLIMDAVKDFDKRGIGTGEEYYIKNYKKILDWNEDDYKETSSALLTFYKRIKKGGMENYTTEQQNTGDQENVKMFYSNLAKDIREILGTDGIAKNKNGVEFICTIKSNGMKVNEQGLVDRIEVEKYEYFATSEEIEEECILEQYRKSGHDLLLQGENWGTNLYFMNHTVVLTFKSNRLIRPIYLTLRFAEEAKKIDILKRVRYILTFRNELLGCFERDLSTNFLQQMLETLSVQHQLSKARSGFHMSGEANDIKNPLNAAEAYFFGTRASCEVDRNNNSIEEYKQEKQEKIVANFGYDLEKALYGMAINTRIGRANIKLLTKDDFDPTGLNLGYLPRHIEEISMYSHFRDKFMLCDESGRPLDHEGFVKIFRNKRYKGKEDKGEIIYMHRDYLRALLIEAIQSAGKHSYDEKEKCIVYLWSRGARLWIKNKVRPDEEYIQNTIAPALMRESEGISLVTLCEMFSDFYKDDKKRRVKILYEDGYLSIGVPIFEGRL